MSSQRQIWLDEALDPDDDFSAEDFATLHAIRRGFAKEFFRQQAAQYEAQLGSDAAVPFTRWWTEYGASIAPFAETQSEFDKEAYRHCDKWLSRWARRQLKAIASGQPPTKVPPTLDDEVKRLSAAWGVTKNQILRVPPSIPSKTWKPCKHWGGKDLCQNCKAERDGMVGDSSAQVQAMFDNHRPFVRKQLHAELRSRTNSGQHPEFRDIESQVWMTVKVRIEGYAERGQPIAWLKTVVHSTVQDYFKGKFRDMRDERKTANMGAGTALDLALDQNICTDETGDNVRPMVKSVKPEGVAPDSIDPAHQRDFNALQKQSAAQLDKIT